MSVLVNFALDKPTLIKREIIGHFAAVPALGERNTLECICPSAVIKELFTAARLILQPLSYVPGFTFCPHATVLLEH